MTMQFTARHSEQDHLRRVKSLASDRRMCRRLTTLSMLVAEVVTISPAARGGAGRTGCARARGAEARIPRAPDADMTGWAPSEAR
mgnify:CR=1 FL=1